MAKITRRTGKTDRLGGVFGAIVSGAFMLLGFFIPTPSADPMFGGGVFFDPMDNIATAFKVVWIVVCGASCLYNIYLAVKGEGLSKETVDVESDGDPLVQVQVSPGPAQPGPPPIDFEEKLRKLNKLRDDGLITNAEYERKREELLNEKW